jgi:hypothetical protein
MCSTAVYYSVVLVACVGQPRGQGCADSYCNEKGHGVPLCIFQGNSVVKVVFTGPLLSSPMFKLCTSLVQMVAM